MPFANSTARKACSEDCKQIYNFVCDLEEHEFEYSIFENLYLRNITNPENIYLVAEEAGILSGYISCHAQFLLHHGGRVFEIQELYVVPEFRKMGVGKLLVETLESTLHQLDYQSLEVTANKKREKTHDFYAKMGFQFSHLKFTKSNGSK